MKIKRYAMRYLGGGNLNNDEQQTAGGLAHQIIQDGPGQRTTLGILADKLQDNEHPAADPIRRLYHGDGEEIDPDNYFHHPIHEYNSSRIFDNKYAIVPTVPHDSVILPHSDKKAITTDPNTSSLSMHYLNHPTGHYFQFTFNNRDYSIGRRFLLPVTPDEVQNYANELKGSNLDYVRNRGDDMLRALNLPHGGQETNNPYIRKRKKKLSREEPLTISYRRNSLKRYAHSTVSRIMGHGDNSKDISPAIAGSRLGIVLREIQHHNNLGKSNDHLRGLVQKALLGSYHPKLFTGIRDELLKSNDARGIALARQYNWHRMGEGLERDSIIKKFVEEAARGGRHENNGQAHRRFYNGVAHLHGITDRQGRIWFKAMQDHLQNTTGKQHSYDEILDSLRRNAETEDHIEKINRLSSSGRGGGMKYEVPEYEHPAYTGTPKPGYAPPKITPLNKRASGQFTRRRNVLRYSLFDELGRLKGRVVDKTNEALASPSLIPIEKATEKVSNVGRNIIKDPKNTLSYFGDLLRNPHEIEKAKAKRYITANRGRIEHEAMHHALAASGIAPPQLKGETDRHYQDRLGVHVNDIKDKVHDYIKNNPNDTLVKHYNNVNDNLHNARWAPSISNNVNTLGTGTVEERLAHGYIPIVKYLEAQKGNERAPTNFLSNKHLKPMLRASIEDKNKDKYEVVDLDHPDVNDNTPLPFETHFELQHHPYSIEGLGGIRPEEKKKPEFRLPSGFVEPPPKPKRVIKNPALPHSQRQEIYQSIAHALANREDVHEVLNREYGFGRATATKHFNNFLKIKEKPKGKVRPERQLPIPKKGGTGPGKVKRKKFDRTDLLAIPIKYAKEKLNKDKAGNIIPQVTDEWELPEPEHLDLEDYPEEGLDESHSSNDEPKEPIKNTKGKLNKDKAGNLINNNKMFNPLNEEELSRISPDTWDWLERYIPHGEDTHEINLDNDEEEPIKHSAVSAPKGGIIVRGTQYKGGERIPSPDSKFMNPKMSRRNKLKLFLTNNEIT